MSHRTKSNMNSSNSNRSAPLGSDPGGAGDSEAAEETCCPMCRDPTAGSAHRYDLVDKDDGRQVRGETNHVKRSYLRDLTLLY